MPNYVRNILQIDAAPEKVEEILNTIKSDTEQDNPIDFNKIIPMPESLNIESGSQEDLVALYMTYLNPKVDYYGTQDYDKELPIIQTHVLFPKYRDDLSKEEIEKMLQRFSMLTEEECLAKGKQYFENFCNYGATSWFHWCVDNWGTKWTACDAYLASDDTIIFDTAWNHPEPIIQQISEKFEVKLKLAYADEDYGGGNLGYLELENGECTREWHPDTYEECERFGNDIWYVDDCIKDFDEREYI